jgi:hypothetical protein
MFCFTNASKIAYSCRDLCHGLAIASTIFWSPTQLECSPGMALPVRCFAGSSRLQKGPPVYAKAGMNPWGQTIFPELCKPTLAMPTASCVDQGIATLS